MKFGLKIISIALIMLTGTSYAVAGPWGRREAQPRMMRQQPRFNQQERQQEQRQQEQHQQESHQQNQPPQPSAQHGQQGQANVTPMAAPNTGGQFFGHPAGGRPGQRMSVEERQKLRQQINETAQDIYQKK